MSLADHLPRGPRILVFDIETAPWVGAAWGKKWKPYVQEIQQHEHLLSVAWKFLGEDEVQWAGLPDDPHWTPGSDNDYHLTTLLHGLLTEADIAMGFNGRDFDCRMADTRFLYHQLGPTSRYQVIDPLLIIRKHFRLPSNSMNDVAGFLGVDGKLGLGVGKLWRDCMTGDEQAWEDLRSYNIADVEVLESIWYEVRPWAVRPRPNQQINLGHWAPKVYDEAAGEWVKTCPVCGGGPLRLDGEHRTGVSEFPTLRCDNCGADSRARYAKRQDTGGVRAR